ncbi:MAG: HlyD family type I secretion periplasmic adaptor subunit [Alphaproteobacteria bacterium]
MSGSSLITKPTEAAVPAPVRVHRAGRQTRYLAQSIVLEETGTSLLVRLTILVVSVTVVIFIIWAALTSVQEVAVAFGQVVPRGSVQTVQHLEGGIVREVLVEEGQLVDAGQPLVRFDRAQVMADLDQNRARLAGLELRIERLRAFAEGRAPDFSFMTEPAFASLLEDQKTIHGTQVAALASSRSVLERTVDQRRSELRVVEEQQRTARQQVELVAAEVAMREELVAKGLASKITYYENKKELARLTGEHTKLVNQAVALRDSLAEATARLSDIGSAKRNEALIEMGTAAAELAQVRESMGRMEDRAQRLEVVAPVQGLIQNIRVKTIGAVIPAGGTVVEVVPTGAALTVEARINARDVGHIKVGQPVKVKVTAFDFSRFGAAMGILESMSATTYMDEQNKPYYKGIVALSSDRVGQGDAAAGRRILPGMTVQADIVTGDKTILEYLLKPIYVSVQNAFHER